jgi:hypothetical protein
VNTPTRLPCTNWCSQPRTQQIGGNELLELRPGLVLVDSAESRSAVYHALKAELHEDSALLVAELHEVPKMKGMASGAVAWTRARLGTGRSG